VQLKELTPGELKLLKEWDAIWQKYDKSPEAIGALMGIYMLLANPGLKNIEFDPKTSSPFHGLFSDPLSLRELLQVGKKLFKLGQKADDSIKEVIKGVIAPTEKEEMTFDVELSEHELSKIGFKRKQSSRLQQKTYLNPAGVPIAFWTSHKGQNAKIGIYQSVMAAINHGAFCRNPLAIHVDQSHFRYPVYQQKQSYNMMLVLDISNSVKWILKFMDKIISMLTAQANAAKDKLGLIVFNDDRAQILLYPTANVRHVIGMINTLAPKGKTPLAEGMKMAVQTLEHSRFQVTGMSNAIVLLSDCFPEPLTGEYREQLDEPVCQQILHVCDRIAESRIKLLVLNPSAGNIPNYEQHLGYRLGTLAAERAKGSFLNLVAEPSGSVLSGDSSYVLSKQMLHKFQQGINEFRMGDIPGSQPGWNSSSELAPVR